MRITAAAKQQNRAKILRCARKLFASNGFDETTTRDVAAGAGLAAGTLFNYFPNKEALAMTLLAEALADGTARWEAERRDGLAIEEALFALIAALLRSLGPHRPYVGEVMATAMGLGTCWVGYLTAAAHMSKTIGTSLDIPKNRNIYGALMVGHPKHTYKRGIPRKPRDVRWV